MPAAASVSVQLALSKPTNVASLGTLRKGSTHTVAAVMAQRERQQATETDNRMHQNRTSSGVTVSPSRNKGQKTTAAISYEDVVKLNDMKNKWRPVKKSALNRRDLSVKSKTTPAVSATETSVGNKTLTSEPSHPVADEPAGVSADIQLGADVAPLVCMEPSSISKTSDANPASSTAAVTIAKNAPPAKWHNLPILQETYGGGFNRTSWVREDQVEFCRSDEEFYAQLRDAVAGREPTQLPPFDPATLKTTELENPGMFDPSMFPNILVTNGNLSESQNSGFEPVDAADMSHSSSSVFIATSPQIRSPRRRSEMSLVLPAPRLDSPTVGSIAVDDGNLFASRSVPQLLSSGTTPAPSHVPKNDDDEEDFGLVIGDDDDANDNGKNGGRFSRDADDSVEMTTPRSSPTKARASTAKSKSRTSKTTPTGSKRSRSESSKSRSASNASSSRKKKKKVITLGGTNLDAGSSSASHIDERSSSNATPTPRHNDAGDSNEAEDTEMHVEGGQHPCGYPGCGKVFGTHDSLRKHLKTHRVRDFVCDQCGKSFLDKSKLNRHQLVHSGQKAFECEICGKKFSLEYNMRTHQRIHSGERPFECFCKRSFAQSTNLKNHLLTHVKKGEIPSDQAEDYILRLYKRGPRKDIVIEVPDMDGAEGGEADENDDEHEFEHDSEDEDDIDRLEMDDSQNVARARPRARKANTSTAVLPADEDSGNLLIVGEQENAETDGLVSSEAMLM